MQPLDSAAVEEIWEAFYPRLRALVARKVAGVRRPLISESEVALSAFNCFVERARKGHFDINISDENLWALLRQFAVYKANDHIKRARAIKRRMDLNAIGQADADAEALDHNSLPGGVETAGIHASPSLELEVSELFESLMCRLPDDLHRDVVLLKLQGATTANIAECCGVSLRKSQRLVKDIESLWTEWLKK